MQSSGSSCCLSDIDTITSIRGLLQRTLASNCPVLVLGCLSNMVSGCYRICLKPGKARHFRGSRAGRVKLRITRAAPRFVVVLAVEISATLQTLACAGGQRSAETAIDCGSPRPGCWPLPLVSASVRSCPNRSGSHVIRFFVSPGDLATIDNLEPKSRRLSAARSTRCYLGDRRRWPRRCPQEIRAGTSESRPRPAASEGTRLDVQ